MNVSIARLHTLLASGLCALLVSGSAYPGTSSTAQAQATTGTSRPPRTIVTPLFFAGRPGPRQFLASTGMELKEAQRAINLMLAVKGPRTIANTVMPYNEAMAHGENVAYQSHLLEAVHPDSSFRSAAEEVSQRANNFLDDLSLRRDVYDALAAVDVSKADPPTRYFMMRTLRDFRRAGVDMDAATRKTIAGIYEELVRTSQDFDRNIRTDSRRIEADPSDLAGLPDD